MPDESIQFVRAKKFQILKELGRGAFGKTVLLYDNDIQEQMVCKKYDPVFEENREEYYRNFVQEIKFLYKINHPNIVKIFNFYLYPERFAGYIMMEYVRGDNIQEHVEKNPQNINQLFVQAVDGFEYLERNGILHRDIRFQNILVGDNASLKIIDFGFGKQVFKKEDFNKSISLAWQFDPPEEFKRKVYNFATDVYFVGKLFERLVSDNEIVEFNYQNILSKMCKFNPSIRISSFADVRAELYANEFQSVDFDDRDKMIYRTFATALSSFIVEIEGGAKYFDSVDEILVKLISLHQSVVLEDILPDNAALSRCFIDGSYRYQRRIRVSVDCIEDFITLLRNKSREKQQIILRNIHSRLDSVKRYEINNDDEIPF